MGITNLSLARINRYIKPQSTMLLIGCQNIFSSTNYGEVAATYFTNLGHIARHVDITGCQGAEVADLREDLHWTPEYDMVNQCGTIEHCDCDSLYIPFFNMHNACRVGGVMIHENPETKSWFFHGNHYFSLEFYPLLAQLCGYELLENTREAAMSNEVDGWNICAVLRKTSDDFITKETFDECAKYIFTE